MKRIKFGIRVVRDLAGLTLITAGMKVTSPRTVVLVIQRIAKARDEVDEEMKRGKAMDSHFEQRAAREAEAQNQFWLDQQ